MTPRQQKFSDFMRGLGLVELREYEEVLAAKLLDAGACNPRREWLRSQSFLVHPELSSEDDYRRGWNDALTHAARYFENKEQV